MQHPENHVATDPCRTTEAPRDRRGATYGRPARFVIAGGLATAVHWSVMAAGVASGIDAAAATAGGAAAGAAANYWLQRHALGASAVCHRSAVPRYLLVCTIAWVANLIVFASLQALTSLAIGVAQVVTTVIVAVLNLFLYDRVVFRAAATA